MSSKPRSQNVLTLWSNILRKSRPNWPRWVRFRKQMKGQKSCDTLSLRQQALRSASRRSAPSRWWQCAYPSTILTHTDMGKVSRNCILTRCFLFKLKWMFSMCWGHPQFACSWYSYNWAIPSTVWFCLASFLVNLQKISDFWIVCKARVLTWGYNSS